MRSLLLLLILLLSSLGKAQISVSPAQINFATVTPGTPETLNLTLQNNSGSDWVVKDLNFFHSDVYTVNPTSFTVPDGGSQVVTVTCDPVHNLDYIDYLIFESLDLPIAVKINAEVEYPGAYYFRTQNKSHEELKAALKSTVTNGSSALSYSYARDLMFMQIDNEAANGQGASQNTLECVYTGGKAVGYSDRADCQNNYGFNTEHTIPQSSFNELLPMRSDLHHLFPVTATSNSQRSSNPFGNVSNPSWQSGGSQSDGFTFEPRDVHKGTSARAMLYFVIRYQDYQGFVAPQEALLRQWSDAYPPTNKDRTRNDLVETYQNNRNPFIDHPEFLERIASVTTTDLGPTDPIAQFAQDTLDYGLIPAGMTHSKMLYISNQGTSDLQISNISYSSTDLWVTGNPNGTVPVDSLLSLTVRFRPSTPFAQFTGEITMNTNDPNHPSITFKIVAETGAVNRDKPFLSGIEVGPNPASEFVTLYKTVNSPLQYELFDLQGKVVLQGSMDAGTDKKNLPVQDLQAGLYFLRLSANGNERRIRLSIL